MELMVRDRFLPALASDSLSQYMDAVHQIPKLDVVQNQKHQIGAHIQKIYFRHCKLDVEEQHCKVQTM